MYKCTESLEKSKLFAKKFRVEVILERFLVHIADGKIGVAVHDDAVFVDLQNLVEVDDVGTVDAHEILGQALLHLLHGKQGDDGLGVALHPHLEVFAHGLDIADVADGDLDDAIVGLEENGVSVGIAGHRCA